jgi:Alpha-glutamyl/putrescinyl thymine pyrophosphorylase clade 3
MRIGTAARAVREPAGEPEAALWSAHAQLRTVISFGRTARYDFLTLLRNLGVYALEPDRIYMVGATGPLTGARRLFGVSARTRQEQEELDDRALALARAIGVDPQAMEDALCNWQTT